MKRERVQVELSGRRMNWLETGRELEPCELEVGTKRWGSGAKWGLAPPYVEETHLTFGVMWGRVGGSRGPQGVLV